MMPDPTKLPEGCVFCERCKYAVPECSKNHPGMVTVGGTHQVRSHPLPLRKRRLTYAGTENRDITCGTSEKYFTTPKGTLHAVDDVNFSIRTGETLGVVGESGCGKSTMGRAILRLHEPTSGKVYFEGKDILGYNKKQLKDLRKDMQIIFQDPFASLNPRMTVSEAIIEPLLVQGFTSPMKRPPSPSRWRRS